MDSILHSGYPTPVDNWLTCPYQPALILRCSRMAFCDNITDRCPLLLPHQFCRASPSGPGFLRILYHYQLLAFLHTFRAARLPCRPGDSGLRFAPVRVRTASAPYGPLPQKPKNPTLLLRVPHAGTAPLPLRRILCVIPLPGMSNHHRFRARLSAAARLLHHPLLQRGHRRWRAGVCPSSAAVQHGTRAPRHPLPTRSFFACL
jgi:hypothetical protein